MMTLPCEATVTIQATIVVPWAVNDPTILGMAPPEAAQVIARKIAKALQAGVTAKTTGGATVRAREARVRLTYGAEGDDGEDPPDNHLIMVSLQPENFYV
jgi:hypothetical protein